MFFFVLNVVFALDCATGQTLNIADGGWELNLNTATIVIQIQNAALLRLTAFDCTAFTIQSHANALISPQTTRLYTLTDPCVATVVGNVRVQILLNENDLDAIKLDEGLATGVDARFTYLSVRAGSGIENFVSGTATPLPAIASRNGRQAVLVPDSTRPQVTAFRQFDLDSGELNLLFNEPVNLIGSLNVSSGVPSLRLQHHISAPAALEYFDVREVTAVGGNGRNVTIRLSLDEVNRLKLMRRVCSSIADCWLTVSELFITDMAGNRVMPLMTGVTSLARLLQDFVIDDKGAVLTASSLNLTTGQLTLDFDEPIDSASVRTSAITFLSAPSANELSVQRRHQLTGGKVLTSDGQRLTIALAAADLNALKASEELATYPNNTHLAISSNLTNDLAFTPNPVQAIPQLNASQIGTYFPDTVAPQVSGFTIDFEGNQITITWNEPIRASRTDLRLLAIRSSQTTTAESHTFDTDGGISINPPPDGTLSLTFNLSTVDLTQVKLNTRLAANRETTFLWAIAAGATVDMRYNRMEAIAPASAIPATVYLENRIQPELSRFSLDLNTGLLNMTFNDAVNGSSFRPDTVTLQNAVRVPVTDTQSRFTFSTATRTSTAISFTLVVRIARADLDALKSLRQLARNSSTTYLIMTANVVDDIFETDAIAITNGQARPVAQFIGDTTEPRVSHALLDMDSGRVRLDMSETVDLLTLDTSQIALQVSSLATWLVLTLSLKE